VANAFLTDDVISLEALSIFENSLVLGKHVDRTKDALFGKHDGSNRSATVRIRKPNMYTIRSGAAFAAQDVTDLFTSFTIATQIGVDVALTSAEMAQSLTSFSDQIIRPSVVKIANAIDLDIAGQFVNIANSVGTPGAAANALSTYLSAGVKLDQNSCPRDGQRYMITGPQMQADIIDALKGLIESGPKVAGQYESGEMRRAVGFNWDMDQNVKTFTSGQRGGAPLVNGAPANGATQVVTDAWTAAAANRLKAGDVFTIANVFAVNPVSKVSTGVLKQFTATADVASDGAGNATIPWQEPIYFSGPYQNVDSQPADNAALSFYSATSTLSGQSLGGHKSAMTLGFAELPKPDGVDMASTKTDRQLGVSIRFIRWYDGSSDQFKARFDVLYGIKVLRPEWLVRVHGAAA
jgi:hypothetical protein